MLFSVTFLLYFGLSCINKTTASGGHFMTLKKLKAFMLLIPAFITLSMQGLPTHQEIIDELAQFRKNTPQLQDNFSNSASYYLDRVEEAKVLEKATGWADYIKKYVTFYHPVSIIRNLFSMDLIMISQEKTPKTYQLIENISQKMGFEEVPVLYLVKNENFFNAFAAGFLQSISIIALGERMVKETTDLASLEFLIAHELSHVKNHHIIKGSVVSVASNIIYNHLIHEYIANYLTKIYFNNTPESTAEKIKTYDDIAPYVFYGVKLLTVGLITKYYSRICEKDADITAARVVGAQGGINLFKMFDDKFESHVDRDYAILQKDIEASPLKDSKVFALRVALAKAAAKTYETVTNTLHWLNPYRTHPTHDQRIAYLEEFLKEQQAAAAAASVN
jgi:Zn-dependent protease with chaperone function